MSEINLDNPIFVTYINVDGKSRQRCDELIDHYRSLMDNNNITMWYFLVTNQETRVECIYDGNSKDRNLELSKFIKEINSRVDILSNSSSFEDFKINIRDWRIDNVLDEKER